MAEILTRANGSTRPFATETDGEFSVEPRLSSGSDQADSFPSPAGLTRGSMDRRVKPGDDGSGWVNLVGTRANGSFPGAAEEICFGLPSIGKIGAAKRANRSYVRKIKQIWRYPHAKRTGSWLPVASFRFS